MKKNMGSTDKTIRVIVAALIAILYLTVLKSTTLGLILLILAIVLVVTSLIGFCPLYTLFGWNTLKKG
jgi:diacylglycerol kinase